MAWEADSLTFKQKIGSGQDGAGESTDQAISAAQTRQTFGAVTAGRTPATESGPPESERRRQRGRYNRASYAGGVHVALPIMDPYRLPSARRGRWSQVQAARFLALPAGLTCAAGREVLRPLAAVAVGIASTALVHPEQIFHTAREMATRPEGPGANTRGASADISRNSFLLVLAPPGLDRSNVRSTVALRSGSARPRNCRRRRRRSRSCRPAATLSHWRCCRCCCSR